MEFITSEADFNAQIILGTTAEGDQLEAKESRARPEQIAKAVVGLANNRGGVFLYGVVEDPDTKVLTRLEGLPSGQDAAQRVESSLNGHTTGLRERWPQVLDISVGGVAVVVVNVRPSPRLGAVWSGGSKPISYPIRSGETTTLLRPYDVEERIWGYAPRARLLQLEEYVGRTGDTDTTAPCVVHCERRVHSAGQSKLYPIALSGRIGSPGPWGVEVHVVGESKHSKKVSLTVQLPLEWILSA